MTDPANTFQAGLYEWGLPYSIYFVTTLYDYYLYTGDLSFVRQEWPVVQKELAYLRSNTDARHLIVTSFFDGLTADIWISSPGCRSPRVKMRWPAADDRSTPTR